MENASKSFLKRFFQVVAGFVLCLVILLALLPTIISTHFVQRKIVEFANHSIPGSIEVSDLSLSWLGNQEIHGFTLKDKSGNPILQIDQLFADTSLFNILLGRIGHNSLEIKNLNANLVEESPGLSNLQLALGHTVPFRSPDVQAKTPFGITLSNVFATLAHSSSQEPIQIKLNGETSQQGTKGSFDVNLVLNAQDIDFSAKIANFPVAAIDYFIALDRPELAGIAEAALGNTLNVDVSKKIVPEGVSVDVIAKSSTMDARFTGLVDNTQFLLTAPGSLSLTITPKLIDLISTAQGFQLPVRLQKDTQAVASVKELSFPLQALKEGQIKDLDISTVAQVDVAQASITVAQLPEIVALNNLKLTIDAPKTSREATVQLTGQAVQLGHPSEIDVKATLDKPLQLQNIIGQLKKKLILDVLLKKVPVKLLEHFTSLNDVLTGSIGEFLTLQLKSKIQNEQLQFNAQIIGDYLTIPAFQGNIDTSSMEFIGQFKTLANTPFSILAGPNGQLKLQYKQGEFIGEITGKQITARVSGLVTNHSHVQLNEPITLQYVLTPEAAVVLGLNNDNLLLLDKPTPIDLIINPLKVPLDLKNISTLQLRKQVISGALKIEQASFKGFDNTITVRNLAIPWSANLQDNHINLSLSANTQIGQKDSGKISGDFLIRHWLQGRKIDFKNAGIDAKLHLEHLPVLLLSTFLKQDELSAILGNTLNVEMTASYNSVAEYDNTLELMVEGDGLHLKMAVDLEDTISLKNNDQPIILDMTMTPKRFQALRRLAKVTNDGLELAEATKVTATINKLSIPYRNTFSIANIGLKANVAVGTFKVNDPKRNQSLAIENLNMHLDSHRIADAIVFKVSGEDKTLKANNHFTVNGTLSNAFTSAGDLDLDRLSVKAEAKSHQLPAGFFCQVGCLDTTYRDKIEALLGYAIDADVRVDLNQMNGPIYALIKGNNGKINVDGFLNHGNLTLKTPLEVEVAVTPQLGQSVLQDIIPILSGAIKSDAPIKVTVQPKGFLFPLKTLDIQNINVERATIDLGKIQFNNKGELGTVFSLLKPSSQDTLSVWFTPLYVQISKGVVNLQRMDMLLLNRYPIALWGKVNLPKNYVDISIGLTGTSLNNALGITSLADDDMMQIPFKGQLGVASIDKAQATARISSLVAQSQKTTHGIIIGTVLGIASGSMSDKEPPKPTTNPLPWSFNTQQVADQPSSKKRKKDSQDYIEDGASLIINSLFGK